MSEPRRAAARVRTVEPGLLHWSVLDDRIGFRSDAYAVAAEGGTMLIDPLPLAEGPLRTLERPMAAILTIQSHQRSSWRYRARFGLRVYAPVGAEGLEEEPDVWYGEGTRLPGGLRALHSPGPCEASYALLLEQRRGGGVLFLGDLLARTEGGGLAFVPDRFQDAPARTRESVARLAALEVSVVCPGHGRPFTADGAHAIAAALRRDRGRRDASG